MSFCEIVIGISIKQNFSLVDKEKMFSDSLDMKEILFLLIVAQGK